VYVGCVFVVVGWGGVICLCMIFVFGRVWLLKWCVLFGVGGVVWVECGG
jgi:hypothetical protein